MNANQLIALANVYREAADKVLESQSRIKGTIEWNGVEWKGERRERFNHEYQETIEAFHRYAQDLIVTSDELQKAAVKVEEVRRELMKQSNIEA